MAPTVQKYKYYSLTLASDIQLPLPRANATSQDVCVYESPSIADMPAGFGVGGYIYNVNRSVGFCSLENIGVCRIRHGSELAFSVLGDVSKELLAVSLLGAPLGIVFYQRGYIVIHGSCVVYKGKTLLILGQSGAGKSSLALSLVQAGAHLVCDDLIIADVSSGTLSVLTGFPWVKVYLEVAAVCGVAPGSLSPLAPELDKVRCNVVGWPIKEDLPPVAAIYLPCWGDDFSVEKLSEKLALLEIAQHTYNADPKTWYPQETKEVFLNTAFLANTLGCYRLHRPHDLSTINEIVPVIDKHLAALA